ncbi:hypothetical protein ILUMI_21955 [Ignelater luminosus]|uniref:Putative alpha-L-fucosidase n=1 Tax=Ignelater luminosus TaxID=2038154 RepID=A0A8K0FXM3_IGNLU|nr:hypothetical protein ILUMI_21955 [Ignelater luminosus]
MQPHFGILFLFTFLSIKCKAVRYDPTWESLDTRPLPRWYDEAKVGIFLHWGVYAVPAFGDGKYTSSEWFWNYWKGAKNPEHILFMMKNYPPNFSYPEFANDFKAELFDPKAWAKLFERSGARYVVLTSKHHDGYTLWPSTYSFNWNSYDIGPGRDLIGDLFKAIRSHTDLKTGLYYSLYEWFNPMYLRDKNNDFQTDTFVSNKMLPEMFEIVEKYRPEIVWADGDWEANHTYFRSTEFLAWLYSDSPVKDTVVVNDRWGIGIPCNHGDFLTCKDRFNPGELQPFKWENAMTIDKQSWGYRRVADITEYFTTTELIALLVETVSCGGNILINVGPTSDGKIIPIFEERLINLGSWLAVNGEAIYYSVPWKYQNDTVSETWYTSNDRAVYAITLAWPGYDELRLGLTSKLLEDEDTVVTLLGHSEPLKWNVIDGVTCIKFPNKATVLSKHAWAVKIPLKTKRKYNLRQPEMMLGNIL